MRVTSAQIDLSAQHALMESHARHEKLEIAVQADGETTRSVIETREISLASAQAAEYRPSLLDNELARMNPELRGQIESGSTNGEGLNSALMERAAVAGLKIPTPDLLRNALTETMNRFGLDLSGLGMTGSQPIDTTAGPADRFKMDLIRAAVFAFSGRDLKILDPASLDLSAFAGMSSASNSSGNSSRTTELASGKTPPTFAAAYNAARGPDAGPDAEPQRDAAPRASLIYSYQDRHEERETTSFAAAGVVTTADGEQIEIQVELTMGRQFISEESGEVRVGAELTDPLVINFEGTAAELTDRTYAFDLDTDGEAEQIHFIGPNSGFLALDANENGLVDDGSELFGPTTGQGFAELAVYDEDGNNFIDESDSVYEGLRVWQKDADGQDRLIALGQAGVGAIYLGSIDTPFQVKDDENELQGVVRSSGVYLKEEGGQPTGVGTIQQLDLVV
ncbi:MAG: hypothetical protein HN712_24870 [Gemmatimonadetes bacterium]|nr:hypothetical protein [Gemmatimonadota bacterium]MBT7863573.1 hypothetical protein [Gemmatimonadota bacterium]